MRLYLCRHADAVDGRDDLEDERRYLTARGRRQAASVGHALASGDAPDAILMSPLVRAVQTAEGLAREVAFDGALEVESALAPGGRLGVLLAALASRGAEAVYAVGHEPQMGDWGAALLGRRLPRAFAKAGVLRIDFDGPAEPGRGRAAFFLDPSDLQRRPV